MKQGILGGTGCGMEGKRIRVIEEEGKKRVFINGNPYMSWPAKDNCARRIAIAQMYELGMVTEEELANAFGVHVKSVRNYVKAFRTHGVQGLIGDKSGPKESWKLDSSLKSKILFIALKYDIFQCQDIQERLEKWFGDHVSPPSIGQVLIENGIVEEKISDFSEAMQHVLPFEDSDEGQLDLGLSMKDEIGLIMHEGEKKEVIESEINVSNNYEGGQRRSYSRSQRIYLDRLEQGEYNAYAGGLLFVPLLEKYAFLEPLKRVLDIETHEGYNLEQLCLALLYMDLFGFRSLEDIKRAYREEFGLLIGRAHSPTHFTLRRFLHKVRQLEKGEELIEQYGYQYLKNDIAKWGLMYIDGHFFPYYGMYPIKKGFHGVRKIPMKGSYHFLAVDENFTPWIFLVRSSSEDLLEKIPEIIKKAKRIGKSIGLDDNQMQNVIVVFDREGYSGELYRYLDGRDRDDKKRRAVFVTWAKYSDWAYKITEKEFCKSVVVSYEVQRAKEFKYVETERKMSKYGKIRTIVVQREADKKRAVIYTNASEEQLETEEVVRIICRRWGEENLIKVLLEKHYIDYTPGYVMEEMQQQPMVDNPEVIELKKKKATLAGNVHKLKVKFADKILKETRDEVKLREIKTAQLSLLEDILKIENEILFIDLESDKLPAQVTFDQAHRGRRLRKQDYEKKRFLDCIKVFACNMEMKMCELLLNHYDAKKEIFPALLMIVNRGGYVKSEGGELRVRLKRFKNRAIDYAARRLCEDLNMMSPVTLDAFRFQIRYEVT